MFCLKARFQFVFTHIMGGKEHNLFIKCVLIMFSKRRRKILFISLDSQSKLAQTTAFCCQRRFFSSGKLHQSVKDLIAVTSRKSSLPSYSFHSSSDTLSMHRFASNVAFFCRLAFMNTKLSRLPLGGLAVEQGA